MSATGGLLYSWSPFSGLNNPNISNPKGAPAASTTYKVVVADGTCKDSTATTVTVLSKPSIAITPNSDLCEGKSIQLNATGGNKYSWSPSAGINNSSIPNPIASPSATTTYKAIVTNYSGCTDSAITTITIRSNPTVSISPSLTLCAGDTTQLSSSGGSLYIWSPGFGLDNPAVSNPKASPNVSTTYTSIVTAPFGCKDSASTTITVIPKPVLYIGSDTSICEPISFELDGTVNGATSYSWNTGDVTPKLRVVHEGIYLAIAKS